MNFYHQFRNDGKRTLIIKVFRYVGKALQYCITINLLEIGKLQLYSLILLLIANSIPKLY